MACDPGESPKDQKIRRRTNGENMARLAPTDRGALPTTSKLGGPQLVGGHALIRNNNAVARASGHGSRRQVAGGKRLCMPCRFMAMAEIQGASWGPCAGLFARSWYPEPQPDTAVSRTPARTASPLSLTSWDLPLTATGPIPLAWMPRANKAESQISRQSQRQAKTIGWHNARLTSRSTAGPDSG